MAHTVAHDDDARLGDFNLDADHVRWFDQPPADEDRGRRREHGHEVIRRWQAEWLAGTSLTFAIRLASDGVAIGEVDLQPRPPVTANIAFAVIPQHRREGYATHAVRLLAVEGLGRFGFRRIELMCDVENVASRKVAERAGFSFEGIRRGSGWYEHVEEWRGVPRGDPRVRPDRGRPQRRSVIRRRAFPR
jgi:RimJ/RimL family protein N-acetyltransferase